MKTKEPPSTERYARWCGRSVDKIIIYLLPDYMVLCRKLIFEEALKKLRKRRIKVSGNKPMHISLTGEKSHKVNIPTGQGSFSIGTKGISKGKYDVWVEKDNFSPLCSQAETRPCQLPVYKALEKAVSVDINSSPMGKAFDCKSLLQFQNLTSLNLTGNLANLESLTELKHLERIGLRFVPDLTNMPKLMNWKNLKSFIGWNIEETAGNVLKAELNQLLKEKELDYSSVSKLRKTIWFTTEYGIPFSGWEDKNAKIATKAYKACLKEIKKSKTENVFSMPIPSECRT